MKYCVSGRQQDSILKKVDEIKFNLNDIQKIQDIIQMDSNKSIIISLKFHENIDIKTYNDLSNQLNKLVIGIENLNIVKDLPENVKWYWSYPIQSYYELDTVLKLGPEYILLGPPLCFDLKNIKSKTNAKIRLVANVANLPYLPRENGINGCWIRPENIEDYEEYVDVIEFEEPDLTKEATLLHIYQDNKKWPGNLNLLLTNFNINVNNNAIPKEIGKIRTSCGQKCMSRGTCNYCNSVITFANAIDKALNS